MSPHPGCSAAECSPCAYERQIFAYCLTRMPQIWEIPRRYPARRGEPPLCRLQAAGHAYSGIAHSMAVWRAPASSRLDRPGGEAGDIVLDEERVDDRDRDRAEQGAGHQLPPIEHVAADQLGDDADRHGANRTLGQEDQGVEKFVLREREGENAGGD